MVTRTKCGWMALGGLLVLFGIVLACKLRDGSRALAQSEPAGPAQAETKNDETKPTAEPPLAPVEKPALPLPPGKPFGGLPSACSSPASSLAPVPPSLPLALPNMPEIKPVGFETATPLEGSSAGHVKSSDPRPILIHASATMPSGPLPPLVTTPTPAAPSDGPPVKVATPPDALPTSSSVPPLPPVPSKPMPPKAVDAVGVKPVAGPKVEMFPSPLPTPARKLAEVKVTAVAPVKVEVKEHVGEPPLAPSPGPVVIYHVASNGETFKTIARKTLGSVERWTDIHKLNPALKTDVALTVGSTVRLPGDACVQDEETVKPLPALRSRTIVKVKTVLPLTGTYPVTLDEQNVMTLPKAILKQLGSCDTLMVSPGSDRCLWLTNQAHLERLAQKLEKSPARESDKNGFKRLYYAQTQKVPMKDGRVAIADKLAAFAGLHQEVVLVGIDDHFEVWDAARWRRYTQTKKAIEE